MILASCGMKSSFTSSFTLHRNAHHVGHAALDEWAARRHGGYRQPAKSLAFLHQLCDPHVIFAAFFLRIPRKTAHKRVRSGFRGNLTSFEFPADAGRATIPRSSSCP